MINRSWLEQTGALHQRFATASPFRHVCIDEFFTPADAESALADFPEFQREYAMNEFGQVGGKAVRTELSQLGPFYRRLQAYLDSKEFLSVMSQITGISDLRTDPRHYGGGTHENLHGQELDPHIDFNFDPQLKMHRRLNLLLYLNKEWNDAWGGSIDLHKNPRRPAEDEVKSFSPIFNRAVIFETNEISWHGFKRIEIPPEKRHLSRKCISIYLYTLDRPAEEIAAAHGTFYVQRPLPAHIRAGHVLSPEDFLQIQALIQRRDGWIEHYQKNELVFQKQIEQHVQAIAAAVGVMKLPVEGDLTQLVETAGIYADRWVGDAFTTRLGAWKALSHLRIEIWVPDQLSDGLDLEIDVGTGVVDRVTASAGTLKHLMRVDLPAQAEVTLSIRAARTFCPRDAGSPDERRLAFTLGRIVGIAAEEPRLPLGSQHSAGHTLGASDEIELREILE